MASNKQISARIPKELYERFTEKVASEGKQSGKVIEQLLEAYCEGNIPDGSSEVASDNEEVVAKKIEINQLVADEVAKATQQLEARLEEVEGKLSKVADGSNMVETSYNEVDNDSVEDGSKVVASDSKVVASDSSSKVEDGSKVVADGSGSSEVADGNNLEEVREYLIKGLGIDEEKSLAEEISYELGCGYSKVLNRIQGKPKKRLDEMDKAILKELENYREN